MMSGGNMSVPMATFTPAARYASNVSSERAWRAPGIGQCTTVVPESRSSAISSAPLASTPFCPPM